MNKYETYRNQYPTFRYIKYELQESESQVQVQYFFEIPGLSEFTPKTLI